MHNENQLASSIFFCSDTGDSSGHQVDGVHGHLGIDIMYSKSCKANSFMRVRHVPEKRRRCGQLCCYLLLLLLLYTECRGIKLPWPTCWDQYYWWRGEGIQNMDAESVEKDTPCHCTGEL